MTRRCRPLREFHVDEVEESQLETVNQMSKGNADKSIVGYSPLCLEFFGPTPNHLKFGQ
jgi:hypothetical protein